jgi:hypothetical protein
MCTYHNMQDLRFSDSDYEYYHLVGCHGIQSGTLFTIFQGNSYPKDEGSILFQKISNVLPDFTALHPRKR